MQQRPQATRETDVLPEKASARLLDRASELDAALRSGATVAELRVAAAEAGISPRAFDAALAELHDAEPDQESNVRRRARPRARLGAIAVAVTAFIVVATVGVSRSTRAGPPTIEEAFRLRCLSAAEAGELIRPVLRLERNSQIVSRANSPRVLTVRATASQMEKVRSILDQYEGTEAPACSTGPAKSP